MKMQDVGANLMLAVGVIAIVICVVMIVVLLSLSIQERIEMLNCVRSGGFWLMEYSQGCSYRAG